MAATHGHSRVTRVFAPVTAIHSGARPHTGMPFTATHGHIGHRLLTASYGRLRPVYTIHGFPASYTVTGHSPRSPHDHSPTCPRLLNVHGQLRPLSSTHGYSGHAQALKVIQSHSPLCTANRDSLTHGHSATYCICRQLLPFTAIHCYRCNFATHSILWPATAVHGRSRHSWTLTASHYHEQPYTRYGHCTSSS